MRNSQEKSDLPGDDWIESIIEKSQDLIISQTEQEAISKLIEIIYSDAIASSDRRLALAAAFDLLATAEYYRSVGHVGWVYCPADNSPLLLYPYTNVCPRCVLKNEFVFHKANKPKSGVIGARTSRLLAAFLQALFIKNNHSVEVRKGVEPVDLVILDQTQTPIAVMFAEIKAAPLMTLPLATPSQLFAEDEDGLVVDVGHRVTDHSALYGSKLRLLLPNTSNENKNWELVPFGSKKNVRDELWAYRSLLDLLNSNPMFMTRYISFWRSALASYEQKSQSDIFWLTNACGQPSSRPTDWPRRSSASGYESISDSKTSVGMDRTDDLKKATYQTLKIGAEGNPSSQYHYRVGIISNIHAVRHYEDYLTAIQDIVWTRHEDMFARRAIDLPPETPLFNLFDGIVALTEARTRDEWVSEIFDF
ncbi:MAG: hypothetical protein GY796_09655 [Chloroflexi bacterium]|nr:hypothetical protein [Chloroflexota bacterium]